jgi:5-methylcytosine-specific restriction endonuclease McrA
MIWNFIFWGNTNQNMINEKDTRTISRTLRFKVLYRDQFKCVLCGRGATSGVNLHIDRIVPHSLAGKTIESNLQTLCEDCNLGKKNRVII